MKTKLKMMLIAAVVALVAFTVQADGYVLEAGQSATLSANATYESMTVNGNLTVDDAVIRTSSLTMTGGCVTVAGKNATLGSGHSTNNSPTTWEMYPDESGLYGTITCTGATSYDKGAGAEKFYLKAENEAVQSDTGYIDFLTLDNGIMNLREAYNETALTGRVSVVGTGASTIYSPGARRGTADGAVFVSGAWAIRMEDGASLLLDFNNQCGYLNKAGTYIDISGNADVTIRGGYDNSRPVQLNRGAHFSHNGSLSFNRNRADHNCIFQINDSDVIGPGVTNVVLYNNMNEGYQSRIEIASGVTATMRNVTVTGDNAYLAGPGTARIDASAEDCSFKAHIKAGDSLVVEKVGANEMVVSATTNIPNLVVREGTVRFTDTVTIGALTLAEDATLVLDGAAVHADAFDNAGGAVSYLHGGTLDFRQTVPDGKTEEVRNWTMNGSTGFVKDGAGTLHLYDPAVTGLVHVAQGTLSFSRHGLLDTYYHIVFKEQLAYSSEIFGKFNLRRWFWYAPNAATYILSERASSDYSSAGEGADPAKLTPGQVTCRKNVDPFVVRYRQLASGSFSYVTNNYDFIHWNFNGDTSNGKLCYYNSCSLTNAADEASWLHLWVRLPALAKFADGVDGFNSRVDFASNPNSPGSNLTAWTVESSATGEDGTWKTVSDVSGYDPINARNGLANNDETKPQAYFSYTQQGVRNLADTLAVQVDSGATLDFTAKTGGQTIDRIVYDTSAGGGTIRNVAVAASGVLEIVDASGTLNYGQPLPLVFDGVTDAENFKNWTVTVNGAAVNRKLVFRDGALAFENRGFVIIVE